MSSGCPRTHYEAKNDIEFLIFLSSTSLVRDYRHVPSHTVCMVLGLEPMALCMPGKNAVD